MEALDGDTVALRVSGVFTSASAATPEMPDTATKLSPSSSLQPAKAIRIATMRAAIRFTPEIGAMN
ncbi:MAG: hypothetical protein LBE91_00540 [Tannerella sp.]|nr:hypothetical protein [Tannerella sp.]